MNEQTAASRDLRAARGRVVALPGRSHSWHGVAALAVAGTAMLAAACSGGSTTAGSGADSGSGVGCGGSSLAAARAGSSSALAASHSRQLVARYEPSQATGWPAPYSPTVGGHTSCVQVSYGHKTYRISLLSFGQAGSSPNPIYEAVPKDPDVAFKKTLAQEYGRHYTFRYLGGLPSGATFVIDSYGVRLYRRAHGLVWGSDLYAIYEPGKTASRCLEMPPGLRRMAPILAPTLPLWLPATAEFDARFALGSAVAGLYRRVRKQTCPGWMAWGRSSRAASALVTAATKLRS
jgi:hypothetical protein